jgi:hypothetical protein
LVGALFFNNVSEWRLPERLAADASGPSGCGWMERNQAFISRYWWPFSISIGGTEKRARVADVSA